MAPLEPGATAKSNLFTIGLFSAQVLVVAALTVHVLQTARHAARTLPPSAITRSQTPLRKRHAMMFSILAFLSIASVSTFAVLWRAVSYLEWAEQGNDQALGSLWTGWYGTGDEGVGKWWLGNWWTDMKFQGQTDALAVATPEAFLYTGQHFAGLLTSAIFMGAEGRRRNILPQTIFAFILLGAIGSLGFALNLFFVTLLYTPVSVHSEDSPRRDALFTPKAAFYYVPVILSLVGLNSLPQLLAKNQDLPYLRFGYIGVPLLLAFGPQFIPVRWGHHHTSKAAAHRSFGVAFYTLAVASFVLQWRIIAFAFFANTPPEHSPVYDLFLNSIGKRDPSKSNRLLAGLGITAQKLKLISKHPAISAMALDGLLTALSLLAWAFTRDLDIEAILENSILSFLAPARTEKHVAFDGKAKAPAEDDFDVAQHDSATPKRRGRPRKGTLTNGASTATAPSAGSTRRSTRKKHSDYEADAEESYEAPTAVKQEVAQTETDGATAAEDLIHGGEATALALALVFVGGLGQLAAGVLGAEVTSSSG